MSIKKYFEVAENVQSLAAKTADEISGEIESPGYHTQDIIAEERFLPYTDFSKPENFARYGSAEEYYNAAMKHIYNGYPYDGSLKEKLEWQNDSTYLDLYIFEEKYPRRTGYVILSADGATTDNIADGYGRPTTPEYIYFRGGPHPTTGPATNLAGQFTGSNYYEPSMNRASNLQLDLSSRGSSLEFWLKKDGFLDHTITSREVIFDLWNGQNSSSVDYGRLRLELTGNVADGSDPVLLTVLSGTTGFYRQPIAAATFTSGSLADGKWHHYAVTMRSASLGVTTKFYVDGELNNTTTLGSIGVNDISTPGLRANLGALITAVSGTTVPSPTAVGDGKLSGSLDEFRYWKTQRTSKQIGRYWFTQVGGGVNSDPTPYIETKDLANVNLGVYFKFNEGITGVEATDSTVLDYSGRNSNGTWTGYTVGSRNTGSAILSSSAATAEFQDPIIYSFHPDVEALAASLKLSGSYHDVNNNAAIYNTIPAWITEEDIEGSKDVSYLTQIISSYFDTLQLQIENLNTLNDVRYLSGSFEKPLPFAERLLSSKGMVAPNLFLDADILEKLADRSEDLVYAQPLQETKNTIYQNIYNNLSYIYKSKGTEKAFRNLIRCFGIDDELIKSNMYASNVEYEMRNNRRNIVVADRFIDFNTQDNRNACVYNYANPSNTNTVGFIPALSTLTGGYATTMETEILFPLKPEQESIGYFNTNVISSSLFGMHSASADGTDTTWGTLDVGNFQVYAIRDELLSSNARFILTGSGGTYVPYLSSDLYEDVYNNTRWNLSVRIKPSEYPLTGLVDGTTSNYIIELHGVQAEAGEIMQEFTVSSSITAPPAGFITGSKRAYIGAHRTDFTGPVLSPSDVKVNAARYWLDYVDDSALRGHILDTENHGALQPHLYAYGFNPTASYGDVTKFDTLVFNWEFLNNTGSDAKGELTVSDISSGSAAFTRFGDLGDILNKQYSASGSFFAASSTSAIDKDFVVAARLNLPENIKSEDMVRVLGAEDQDIFTTESRPTNYYFTFEKSMYQVVSEEMINYFANLKDMNNLIGDQVEKYRPDYKQMAVLRQRFFEKVGNDSLDFDKFYEFYKWFDSSLSLMLGQLVPASADFSDNVRTMIESHVLERPKYQQKFPFLQRKGGTDITGSVDGDMAGDQSMLCSPEEFPQGTGLFTNTALTKRQIGSSNTPQNRPWRHFHAPVPSAPNNKIYWHRYLQERDTSAGEDLVKTIKKGFDLRNATPVKFSMEATTPVGGVARHHNFVANYVFEAAAAWGRTLAGNAPANVLVTTTAGIEKLIESPDEYYPSYKQRLGFKMNPGANTGEDNGFDGNMYAPFSIYSSSVTTGYNAKIISDFTGNIDITNLHHDYVIGSDVPMQGPFTEKYVGGRQYRHTPINYSSSTRALDTVLTRPEGFRIQFANVTSSAGGTFENSMVILPANTTGGAPTPSIPTAFRMRDVAAKRPVNIKNIQMTTGSTIIGNYEQQYQVVSTAGRMQNDPYFKDQSFDFAQYPETLATRGRFPLYEPNPQPGANSVLFEATDETYIDAGSAANWTSSFNKAYLQGVTLSCWFNATTAVDSTRMWSIGEIQFGIFPSPGISFMLRNTGAGGQIVIWVYGSAGDYCTAYSNTFTNGVWNNVVVTIPPDALNGNGDVPTIYMNGVDDTSYTADIGSPDWTSLALAGIGMRIGDAPTVSVAGPPYDGYLCDVAVWTGLASATGASNIYNDGIRPILTGLDVDLNPTGDGLISWHKLGDGLNDSTSGNFYDTVNNSDFQGFPTNFDSSNGIRGVSPETVPGFLAAATGPLYENTANPGGNLNYEIPARTGSASQKTVIVNRFAGSGYEVMSLGYMDPAHEEMSVYNALPYHNLAIIDYGLSGSASADPLAARTITVVDQLDKNRGLDQRATLHCGPFGTDSAYGSVTATSTRVDGGLGYSVTPSWTKTNRNRRRRIQNNSTMYPGAMIATNNYTASVYDNLYVQHAIPQSEQQYAWITASMGVGSVIYGLDRPACFSASTISQLVTASVAVAATHASGYRRRWGGASWPAAQAGSYYNPVPTTFNGMSMTVVDIVTASSHTQGFPGARMTVEEALGSPELQKVSYINHYFINGTAGADGYGVRTRPDIGWPGVAAVLNSVLLNRNGPYGWPTWKQIRAGETKVARTLKKLNLISGEALTGSLPQGASLLRARPDSFVDFWESPVEDSQNPLFFYFEDNTQQSNAANNLVVTVPYGNQLEYFSNTGLNNLLGLTINLDDPRPYDTVRDFALNSDLSLMMNYSQRVYPAMENAYKSTVRARTNFTVNNIYNSDRTKRSNIYGGLENAMSVTVTDQSTWPLDGHLNFTTVSSFGGEDGAGILMNGYSRYSSSLAFDPAPTYAWRYPVGVTNSVGPVYAGDAKWLAPAQAGKDPYKDYTIYSERMRASAKDYSIIPEFRISPLMTTYVEENEFDFLKEIDNQFELTGAAVSSSTENKFYKVYSNSDFLKYFKPIDDDFYQKRSDNLKIVRDKITLSCDAFLKFLPYKGFYPAERTLELVSLFSESLAKSYDLTAQGYATANKAASMRIPLEMLYSPGIMYNTIKSGLAVSSWALHNTNSIGALNCDAFSGSSPGLGASPGPVAGMWSPAGMGGYLEEGVNPGGYVFHPVPFETLYKPEEFFNYDYQLNLTGNIDNNSVGQYLDTAPQHSEAYLTSSMVRNDSQVCLEMLNLTPSPLYNLAVDNFLCEANNLFVDGMASFVSAREEDFGEVVENEVYSMTVNTAVEHKWPVIVDSPIQMRNLLCMIHATAFGQGLMGANWQSPAGP